jgi:peptide/nickel transport system substrate-binding protein
MILVSGNIALLFRTPGKAWDGEVLVVWKRLMGVRIALVVMSITVIGAGSVTALADSGQGLARGGDDTAAAADQAIVVPGSIGQVYPAAPGPEQAGTITWAEQPNAVPDWILPIVAAGYNSVFNLFTFSWEMWRPTYWTVYGVTPELDQAMSLADPPVYSDGDRTVTIKFKSNYKWSDGTPVTADDLLFDIDLTRAAVAASPSNWAGYVPGGFPDDLASTSEPDASTLVLHLTGPVNPAFFTEDILGQGPTNPLPVQDWARTSAKGPLIPKSQWNDPGSGAALRIYNFLVAQNVSVDTYATNPLWRVIDGPYRLSAFNAITGGFTMVPNLRYGGPHAAKMSVFQAVPFTSDAPEFYAVQAGAIDVASIPADDLSQLGTLGYYYFGEPAFGMQFAAYNFKDATGDFDHIAAQLYFRQAMAHLADQQGWIRAYLNGAGDPDYGPIPPYPVSPYLPDDAKTNPYPFSVQDAISLLKAHGWSVRPGGTDACADAGTGPGQCGAGIAAGTKLAFNFIYSTAPALIGQQASDLAVQASKAGIRMSLQATNFNYIIANYIDPAAPQNENKWAMVDFGGETDDPYATTYGLFNTGGPGQIGDYSNPTADRLITASVSGSNPAAVRNEASFLTANQPVLFNPNPDLIWVWKTDVSGPPDTFENLTQYYATPEFWYFTGSGS